MDEKVVSFLSSVPYYEVSPGDVFCTIINGEHRGFFRSSFSGRFYCVIVPDEVESDKLPF